MTPPGTLRKTLGNLEYFTFGFGSMVGVGWLVLMDDWLTRGGPGGAMLGFGLGALLLLPVARSYGRLVREIPDAGAEVAYMEGVAPPLATFAAGWAMILAYAIVCPWEAVAIGNLLARAFPGMNAVPLYEVAGRAITLPRLVAGLGLTAWIAGVNYRGIRPSGRMQDITTLGLLACFAVFAALGLGRGSATLEPLFARPGAVGAAVSTLLVLQIVPYFMTGFESIGKEAEEARADYDPRHFTRAITQALLAGGAFYVVVVAAVAFVYPWRDLVANHLGTEAAFARAFGATTIGRLIFLGALLSLLKVFNGNFVAATRLVFALGRRRMVAPALGAVHPGFGTPSRAVLLIAALTAAGALLGDALLVPVTEVGALASGIGWLAACLALIARRGASWTPILGALVSGAIIVMKVIPSVPGSFTRPEWIALAGWCALGAVLWVRRGTTGAPATAPTRRD